MIFNLVKSVLRNAISQRMSRSNPTTVITGKCLQKIFKEIVKVIMTIKNAKSLSHSFLVSQRRIFPQITWTVISFKSTNRSFSTEPQLWHLTSNKQSIRDPSHCGWTGHACIMGVFSRWHEMEVHFLPPTNSQWCYNEWT